MYLVLFNTHDVVLLMTMYQCLLFAVLVVTIGRGKPLSNLMLAGFLVSHAAIPLSNLINFGEAFREMALSISPNLFYIFDSAYWLEGPLLLWYVRSLIYKSYHWHWSNLIYLVPFLIYSFNVASFFITVDPATRIEILEGYNLSEEPNNSHYIILARELFRVAFGVMCLIEIQRYRKTIKDSYSNIDQIDFSWLAMLTVGFLVMRIWAVFVSAAIILKVILGFDYDFEVMGLTGNYAMFLLITVLIFFSLSHSTLFDGVEAEYDSAKPEPKDEQAEAKAELVSHHMDSEKPYLNSSLTLEQLASQLQLQPRLLSTIINRHFGKNFFEFINGYRIEEAKRLLRSSEVPRLSVSTIMLDVGFNSKGTFNTFFKKIVGMTPSQYRSSAE